MAGLTGVASADRLITIPTGRKLRESEVRLETQFEPASRRTVRNYVGVGLPRGFEVELRSFGQTGVSTLGTFDLSYNFQPPIIDLAPGFSVGVLDVYNRTDEGRRAFFAVTSREGLALDALNLSADITLGVTIGRQDLPFVGLSLPFAEQFRLLMEHNGYEIAAGFEIRPIRELGIRAIFRSNETSLAIQLQRRF